MKNWPSMRISNVSDQVAMGPFGSNIKVDTFVSEPGVPIISGVHLKRSRVDIHGEYNYVTEEHANSLARSNVRPGDVVLTHAGSIGQVSCVPDCGPERFIVSQRQFYIRPNRAIMNPMFLTHYLRSPVGQFTILANASQSGVPSIAQPASYIKSVSVPVPSLSEQGAICDVLDALEEKIVSNEQVISRLDGLFHLRWEKFYSSGGDWDLSPLGGVAPTQYGLTASADAYADGPHFLRVTDINKANWIDWRGVPRVSVQEADLIKYGLSRGDLLVARMGDPGEAAIFEGSAGSAVFASYLVRLKPASFAHGLFLYGYLKSRYFHEYADSVISGTVQRNMNAKLIGAATVAVPSDLEITGFASQTSFLREGVSVRLAENARLSLVRDELLPLLMSGKITVKDAEKTVEEVV